MRTDGGMLKPMAEERLYSYRKNLSEDIILRQDTILNFMRLEGRNRRTAIPHYLEIIDQTSMLYADMYERLTGQSFGFFGQLCFLIKIPQRLSLLHVKLLLGV